MRTTLISITQLKNQRRTLQFLIVFFALLSIITTGMALFEGRHMLWVNLPLAIIPAFIFYKDLKRIKSISYDDEAVYVSKGYNHPVQKISLENIRSITIGRFDLSARLNLVVPVEDQKHVYFKYRAFWFPFDTRLELEKTYKLRDNIDACKAQLDADYIGETQVLQMAELR
jgi:hypothetical protein